MKKAAAIIGFLTLFLFTFATLFKIQHYPGASIMLVFGISVFANIFIPIYFISRIKDEKSTVGKIGNGFAILSLSTFFLGVLFKIQHYPGASVLLIVGTFTTIFPTAILLLIAAFKNKTSMNDFLKGLVIAAFAIGWLLMMGISNFSTDLVAQVLFIDEELTTQVNQLETASKDILIGFKNNNLTQAEIQNLEKLHHKRNEILNILDSYSNDLITHTGGINEFEDRGHWGVLGVRNVDVSSVYLLGQRASLLKSELIAFDALAQINQQTSIRNGKTIDIKSAVDLLLYSRSNKNWEQSLFENAPLFTTLPVLTAIKSRVLTTEIQLVEALSD